MDTTKDQPALEGHVLDDDDIDVDLEDDVHLSEVTGVPTVVRLPGGKIISIPHMGEWEHEHTRMVNVGDFDGWAQGVLNDADYTAFKAARLKNRQIELIFEKAQRRAGTTAGKSSASSGSRRSTARR